MQIAMKCRSLLPGEKKKIITNLSSAELAKRVAKVKKWSFPSKKKLNQRFEPEYDFGVYTKSVNKLKFLLFLPPIYIVLILFAEAIHHILW